MSSGVTVRKSLSINALHADAYTARQKVPAAYGLRTAQSDMRAAHAFKLDLPMTAPARESDQGDQFERAERLFGSATHMVLVNDAGPTHSIMGWVLGSAHVDVIEGPTESRMVVIDIVFTDVGKYAVAERVTRQVQDRRSLSAALSEFSDTRELYRYVESAAGPADSARDAAVAAALDHAVRVWPPLKRPGHLRFSSGTITLPFPL